MSVVNRFAQLQKEKQDSRPKRAVERDDDDDAPVVSRGGAPQVSKGGWQTVEPRSKPKSKKPSDGQPQQQQQRAGGAPKIKRDPGPKPPAGQPVGATLVDPAVEKAQRKAVQALQRHYAKQQAPQREPRQQELGGDDDDDVKPSLQKAHGKGQEALVAAWLGPELPATKQPAKHHDPHHVEIHFVKNHVDAKPAPGKKGAVAWATASPDPASAKDAKKNQQKQPKAQQAAASSAKKESTAEDASAKIHEHLPDGSVVPEVAFQFVIQNVTNKGCRTIPLVAGGGVLNPKAIEMFAKPPKSVKGGFFISAEKKTWSNESTVDEPWMIDSYFKALIPILKHEATQSVAYPFWPKAQEGESASEAEAKVTLKLVPEHATAIELEHEDHHCSIKVMTRRIKVSLRHFAEKLIAEAEMLLKFIAAVSPQLAGSETLKAFPNVERLTAHLDECRSLLAAK